MIGKCSEFGGPDDEFMQKDPGLALYEPWEADLRPDIFLPEDPTWISKHPEWANEYPNEKRQPTWSRLRTDFYYIAMRYHPLTSRKFLQNSPFKVRNPKTNEWAIAFLVDYGPAADLDRIVDCSPALLKRLGAKTEEELDVIQLDCMIETQNNKAI